jgi:hypothetical protein
VKVTEGSAVQLVQQTCDHLALTSQQLSICRTMTTGKLAGHRVRVLCLLIDSYCCCPVDDIGWITKIHSESISRKKLSKILFSAKMCQEIEYCPKLETKKVVEEEVDAPYW